MTLGDSGNSPTSGQLRVIVTSQTSINFAVKGCANALVAFTEVPGKFTWVKRQPFYCMYCKMCVDSKTTLTEITQFVYKLRFHVVLMTFK